jgi:hypothetical protein
MSVEVYTDLWLSGTHAKAYHGSVHASAATLDGVIDELARCAEERGATHVVGTVISVNVSDGQWSAEGTAATLETLETLCW